MNAYEKLEAIGATAEIDSSAFDQLCSEFEANYLLDRRYDEKLLLHRYPNELKQEILVDLNACLQEIQLRVEMRDYDARKGSAGYVPGRINELWSSNKNLKNRYEALKNYCEVESKKSKDCVSSYS